MGEIRKDNLHESLIEELNKLGNIDLSGKQDKTDESLLTESKDVIGAINELFQNANNGKELIADAIGSPLSSDDTFAAMGNSIDSMTADFRTKLINAGCQDDLSSKKLNELIGYLETIKWFAPDSPEATGKYYIYKDGEWLDQAGSGKFAVHSNRNAAGTITEKSDYLEFKVTGMDKNYAQPHTIASTDNKLNLTPYSKICIELKQTLSASINFRLEHSLQRDLAYTSTDPYVAISGTYAELDISGYNTERYIRIYGGKANYTGYTSTEYFMYISKIWLEV